jgi:hypothetical protein
MRYMLLVILPNETADFEVRPEDAAAMNKYNEELTKAGVLLALDGLHPPDKGARVSFPGGKATVTDGPFTEAKELVGGYWVIQAKSKEEAVEWAMRCPMRDALIEVRQVAELSDFPDDVQAEVDTDAVRPSAQPTER